MISQEELDLYRRLQPVFKKKMGPWLTGDRGRVFYRDKETDFVVIANYGEGLLAGTLHCITDEYGKVNFESDDPALLRLPLPIDPRNPERGLWGMIDWKTCHPLIGIDGGLLIGNDMFNSDWCEPTLALLKALAAQEGV